MTASPGTSGLEELDRDTLLEQARRFAEDHVMGDPIVAPDPVNVPMVRHFCQAIGDHNPVYLDEEAANASRHKGIVAPPAMLGVWTLGVERNDGGPRDQVLRRLEAAGYSAVVATDYQLEFHEPIRPGDRLIERRSIEDIIGPKATALGEGMFVMSRYDYTTTEGTLVGTARMRLLKFRPRERAADSATPSVPRRPRPVVNRDNRFYWDGVAARELRIQRCAACGDLRHPPGPMCPSCRSTDHDWIVVSGQGRVYSHVVHHHPPLPGVDLPHVVVLVELEEGVRIVSEVAGIHHRDVRVGLPVQLTWKEVDEDLTVPAFTAVPGTVTERPPPRSAADVSVGDPVPGVEVLVTPTFVITGALATRDLEDVHHDVEAARRKGSDDLFPNILTSTGLAIRLVTDWLGADARVVAANIRLGLPAYVGQVLQLAGEVTQVTPDPDGGEASIEIAVRARMQSGEHLSGTVVATLPWVGDE